MKVKAIRKTSPVRIKGIKISDDQRVTALYHKYENLARSVAKMVARKFGRKYHELEDEALVILGKLLVEKWEDFDPSLASVCTWLRQKIYHLLLNHCVDGIKRRRREGTILLDEPPCPGESRIERIFRSLEKEGRALLKIVIQAPGDLAYQLCPEAPTRSQNCLRSYLEDRRWSKAKISRAWDQVSLAIAD